MNSLLPHTDLAVLLIALSVVLVVLGAVKLIMGIVAFQRRFGSDIPRFGQE